MNVIKYKISPGDSLLKIATQFNTTVNTILNHNAINFIFIYPGQTLNIPTQAPKGKMLIPYVTKKEDTLNMIAEKYGIKVSDIKNYNNLKSLLLKPNQTISIPYINSHKIQ